MIKEEKLEEEEKERKKEIKAKEEEEEDRKVETRRLMINMSATQRAALRPTGHANR